MNTPNRLDPNQTGLRWAYVLGETYSKLDWEQIQSWTSAAGSLWVHLDRSGEDTQAWLRAQAALDPSTADALLAEETRPRCFVSGEGLLLILRGVNLNPGAEPDDMIALRIWSDAQRLISVRHHPLKTTYDVVEEIEQGTGPRDTASLLVGLASHLTERIEPVLENLEEQADALEEGVGNRDPRLVRGELAELRRQVIAVRRYLAPQRVVLTHLAQEQLPWLQATHRGQFRELADRTTRYVEDLEALRERAGVIHDELANHVAEQLNARMYILSLVAAIFLPLSLLTGLLGINVGGIPGANEPSAFLLVCALLVVLGLALSAMLRWRRWF